MSGVWVVAQTKPQQERWAAENVARQGFEWYLPLTLSSPKPKRARAPVCLFPRYLFVLTEGPWRSLRGTFGITGVIMAGESPAILPERAVEALKSREGSDGLVSLPEASAGSSIKLGTPVRVNGGVLVGYKGLYAGQSGSERSKVLVDFLGRRTSVLVGDQFLEIEA